MKAYYNENDRNAAAWLRNLIAAGHIAPGDVDERSIVDVRGADLAGYGQCHFFAGIGGWSYALRLASWPDDRAVWTGSCPCQPLSSAGQRKGHVDERHLWPAFHALIAECRPATVLGEQVASKDGREWLAGVRADLETVGYACGAADLCAAGVSAPHIRQRLYWMADADERRRNDRRDNEQQICTTEQTEQCRPGETSTYAAGGLADDGGAGLEERQEQPAWEERAAAQRSRDAGGMADADGGHAGDRGLQRGREHGQRSQDRGAGGMGDAEHDGSLAEQQSRSAQDEWRVRQLERSSAAGFWSAFDLIPCTDGKSRRVEPGTFPLAHGVSNRMGRLRAYGNAIVPQAAAEFIMAVIALDAARA